MKRIFVLIILGLFLGLIANAQDYLKEYKAKVEKASQEELLQEKAALEKYCKAHSGGDPAAVGNAILIAAVEDAQRRLAIVNARLAAMQVACSNVHAKSAAMDVVSYNKTVGTDVMFYEAELSRERKTLVLDDSFSDTIPLQFGFFNEMDVSRDDMLAALFVDMSPTESEEAEEHGEEDIKCGFFEAYSPEIAAKAQEEYDKFIASNPDKSGESLNILYVNDDNYHPEKYDDLQYNNSDYSVSGFANYAGFVTQNDSLMFSESINGLSLEQLYNLYDMSSVSGKKSQKFFENIES